MVDTESTVQEFLQGVFTDKIVAHPHAIGWPPRSSGLTLSVASFVFHSFLSYSLGSYRLPTHRRDAHRKFF